MGRAGASFCLESSALGEHFGQTVNDIPSSYGLPDDVFGCEVACLLPDNPENRRFKQLHPMI